MAEWLRRLPAKQLGTARASSNLAAVAKLIKGTRDGAEEARLAHNQEVVGSKPTSAKKIF